MSNLNKLNGWSAEGDYVSRTSAQSYMASTIGMTAAGCSSSCGSKEGDNKPAPACGSGDSEPKPSASCGTGDREPKPSSCGASEGDTKPKTTACGSSCGSGEK